MGGGASLMEGVEELMTTTILIGRAISSMSFPGMYRIQDFHSPLAPPLKVFRPFPQFFFLGDEEEEDNNDTSENTAEQRDPAQYQHLFHVEVNGETIYIEDPLRPNEAGWTPLHACCMSLNTVNA
eukprot:gene34248-41456_t